MKTQFRYYQPESDYQRVSQFLIAHHQPGNLDGNWLEPAWEYMHFHPGLDSTALGKIGIWEAAGELVAVCHYEGRLGEAFFQFHPDYRHLHGEMLAFAEENLAGISQRNERPYLVAYIPDFDLPFANLVREKGYTLDPESQRPISRLEIPRPFPPVVLPQGFRLTSLAEECDWVKVHKVMWRGFDHGDDVPMNQEEFESRRYMFDTPKARRALKIAAVAPDGEFASFCGMFLEETGKFAYLEPMATDPAYRGLGLGKAAALEGIRRCGEAGAEIAYVGSDQIFYQKLGFKLAYTAQAWIKRW